MSIAAPEPPEDSPPEDRPPEDRPPDDWAPEDWAPEDWALGELRFEEWFDIPFFEPDRGERLEEMATAGWGPLRLAAAAWVRVSARLER